MTAVKEKAAELVEYDNGRVAGQVSATIDRGEREGFWLEVTATHGTQRIVGRRSGGRGHECFVEVLEGHLIGTVTGDAWLVEQLAACDATDVHITADTLRASLAASFGDPFQEEALRARIKERVIERCPGLAFYWPAFVRSVPPAPPKAPRLKTRVARDLARRDVATLPASSVPSLLAALTSPGVGVWHGLPTGAGSVVQLTSGGRYSGRVAATLHEAGSRTVRHDAWTARLPVDVNRWALDQLTAQRATCALVLVEDELVAAAEHDVSVRIDLQTLAREGNVAVAVVASS
jgi:hypothetical protein